MKTKPRIWLSRSTIDGGCNFCSRYKPSPSGIEPSHDVFIMESPLTNGPRIRVCRLCAKQFRVATRKIEDEKNRGVFNDR